MKIVQIGSYPTDTNKIKGGVEASIYGLAVELAKEHEVCVFDYPRQTVNEDIVEKHHNVKVYRFRNKGKNNICALQRLFSMLKKIKNSQPNICHIHGTNLLSLMMWILLRFNGLKTIVTVHGLIHIEKTNAWKQNMNLINFFKLIYQSIAEFTLLSLRGDIIVDTEYVKQAIHQYKKQWKICREPICHVIPQAISEVFFNLERTPKPRQLLSVGAIGKRKGHKELIKAMEIVCKQVLNIRLTIVGGLHEASYYKELIHTIKILGLESVVSIQLDLSFQELLNLYSEAELFVLHTQEESQGIVFCEAMAVGLPIVTTSVGGVPYVLEHPKNALLSEYGKIDTFADNIIYLLENTQVQNAMTKTNREKARYYQWSYVANSIVDLYLAL
ncbi:MAG: glycosyltransferase family 4 protein [Pigmentiphaga sp.]|nr:glycosyltransferase family 4 protein [Pigmentiphaga sp.]